MYQLTNALKEGRTLIARHGKKDIQVIPARMWDVLCSFVDVPHLRRVDAVFDNDANLVFERVRVDRDDVMKVWPAAPTADVINLAEKDLMALGKLTGGAATGSRPRITDEKLRAMMARGSLPATITMAKFETTARERAEELGLGLDRESVRRLYRETIDNKPRRGRKPKDPNSAR